MCRTGIIEAVGPKSWCSVRPWGLGKPVQLLNAFYRRVAADPAMSLHIYTALCLEVPRPGSHIEAGLAGPIMERLFGDYEELAFLQAFRQGNMPANVQLTELYFKAGSMKNQPVAQQNYISSNYTHIARDMLDNGFNVMVQMVASRETEGDLAISLSCNPDVSPGDCMTGPEEMDRTVIFAGQVHPDMPFMELDAEVPSGHASTGSCTTRTTTRPCSRCPTRLCHCKDYATALHASSLIADGGTLQIGIGSLGDAVAHACIVRHQRQRAYRADAGEGSRNRACLWPATWGRSIQGLYVSTEMFVNGMMHLIDQGVVKRKVL